jgi:hypothetical protein
MTPRTVSSDMTSPLDQFYVLLALVAKGDEFMLCARKVAFLDGHKSIGYGHAQKQSLSHYIRSVCKRL